MFHKKNRSPRGQLFDAAPWYAGIVSMVLVIILAYPVSGLAAQALSAWSTDGHTVYHLQPAALEGGRRGVMAAASDGTVLCYDTAGQLQWKANTGEGFLFDLAAADIDGDGCDEALAASGDGALYALDHTGVPLWSFRREAPVWQVEVTSLPDGSPVILTGGVERVLFALSAGGKILAQYQADGVIRLIGAGNLRGDGRSWAAVATARSGLSGAYTLRLHQLPGLIPEWERPMGYEGNGNRGRYFSMAVYDRNGDGKDEMVFGMSHNVPHMLTICDGDGQPELMTSGEIYQAFTDKPLPGGIPRLPYQMNLLCHVPRAGGDDLLLDLYGRNLLVRGADGAFKRILRGPYAHGGLCWDSLTQTLYLGSGISGGDGIYALHLDRTGWEQAYETLQPVGRMAELERNMAELARQVEAFQPPAYQRAPEPVTVTLDQSFEDIRDHYISRHRFDHVRFVTTHRNQYVERYDPGIEDPHLRQEWESRHSGRVSERADIVADARAREARGEPFLLWGGHGREFGIDFYITPETMEAICEASPTAFVGVFFAELETTDETMARAIKTQLLPLADVFYRHGKKIMLRNKNIFWNGPVYLDMWKPALDDPRYREVFIPSMEETNSRTQGLSLAGRTGLWLTGRVEHMSGRAVTDNANWNRLWEWCQTQHLSHFLRALALSRVLGADLLHINIYTENKTELLPLYRMLEKGLLPRPGRNDILSLSDVAVGVTNPDAGFIDHGTNGHGMAGYMPGEGPYVFDRLDCYWGGAPTPVWDFTRLAYDSRRRLLNFIPRFPYGLVTTISAETDLSATPQFRRMLRTDGRFWYDADGAQQTPGAYLPVVQQALEEAAERLPIRVYGDVSWVALRLDAAHVRLVLIDPGYLDPAERRADIVLQHLEGLSAVDLLSGEILALPGGRCTVTVPAGILRIIDITHR